MQELQHEFVDHWYHSPTPVEKSGGIYVVRTGRNRAKPGYYVGPKFVVYYSIHFVLKGTVYVRCPNHEIMTLNRGDAFCLFPYETYEYFTEDKGTNPKPAQDGIDSLPLEMYWLAFDGVQAEAILRRIGITKEHPFQKELFPSEFEKALSSAAHIWNDASVTDLQLLSSTYGLFANLCSMFGTCSETISGESHWVEQALKYMQTQFMEGISVEDVSKWVGVHRSHFAKVFKVHMSVSPSAYLQDLRMKKAREMLEQSAYSVTEIALSLNFSDLYAFTRAFKNYFGMSPSEHRLTQKGSPKVPRGARCV